MASVLWVVKGLGPGGAERLLVEVAEALRPPPGEIECAYVLPYKDHLAEALARRGVIVTCVGRRNRDLRWPWRLAQLVRRGGYRVIHVHSPLPGSIARLAARSLPRSKRPTVVTTEHNAWSTFAAPTRWLNRLTGRGDTVTLAVSAETAASMQGAAARRVETLRHGVDVVAVRKMCGERDEVRAEFGVGTHTPLVVTVANFREQKDYPNLLQAARSLHDRGVDFRLVAVGQGPLLEEMTAERDRLGLRGVVEFTGFRPDARRVMAGADVFVLASKYEGLPVAAMEASTLGLPIVSTAVGGMAEEWTDGVDALLVAPGDPNALAEALAQMLGDDDLRQRLARASEHKAAAFDIAVAVRRLETIYQLDRPLGPTPARAPMADADDEIEIRPATESDLTEIVALVSESMGRERDDELGALYRWKHVDNPFGQSPSWVAVQGERLIAVRTLMRWQFVRGGELIHAVRAVDTATLPEFQGRGLFRRLTEHALAELAGGVDFVFNTPNSQSLPGYEKMGWQRVGHLATAFAPVGLRSLPKLVLSRQPASLTSEPLDLGISPDEWLDHNREVVERRRPRGVRDLVTNTSVEFWRWRLGLPALHYRIVDGDGAAVAACVRRRGRARELAVATVFGDPDEGDRLARHVARQAGCDVVLRLGAANPRHGYLPLPGGGPLLTWRSVDAHAMPPLPNWHLTLADVSLF